MKNKFWLHFLMPSPVFAPDDGAGSAAAAAAAAADGTGADGAGSGDGAVGDGVAAAATAHWFEDDKAYTPEERVWLKARGLTLDDPLQAIPKLVRGHRSAEQHIGRGVDRIIDRPGEGQAYGEWARANAQALGLPEAADGYKIAPPESWPKDANWDRRFEDQFRAIAFDEGLHPSLVDKLVGLYADKVRALSDSAETGYTEANARMMGELEREYGDKVPAVIARARQGAQAVAEKAGLDAQALEAISGRLGRDAGDAQTIRFMAAIGEMMGEDSAIGLGAGAGSGLTATRAQAEQALADFMKPDGAWAKASLGRDNAAIARLRPEFERLTKAAASFSK